MGHTTLHRRAFLSGTAITAVTLAQAAAPRAAAIGADSATDAFAYEITRTDAAWRDMLSSEEYVILRKGSTELPKSSALWNNTAKGTYCCRGCELTVYDSVWKVELDKGWAFFKQSRENAILMGIDGDPPDGMNPEDDRFGAIIEAHCRRCGSHLGHILPVEGKTLHCINGISLQFRPTAA